MCVILFAIHSLKICVHHPLGQFLKVNGRFPTQGTPCFTGIPGEDSLLCGAEEFGVNDDMVLLYEPVGLKPFDL